MEENSWIWVVQLLGRLYPLAVHFPIGLLVVALLLEILTLKGKRKGLREGIAIYRCWTLSNLYKIS